MNSIHILNGDSLKDQFPRELISGELIVARECLIDGDVSGRTLDEFLINRAQSIHEMYGIEESQYIEGTIPEINKIASLTEGEINLWFEEDLFCQVNFWFICSILNRESSAYFICPKDSLQYGFAGLNKEELVLAYETKVPLSQLHLETFSLLWKAYQNNDSSSLLEVSKPIQNDFPFLEAAIQAQVERGNSNDGAGRPERVLQEIIDEKGSEDFGVVFREFSKRESIYGFGDLQVKRIFDHLIKK